MMIGTIASLCLKIDTQGSESLYLFIRKYAINEMTNGLIRPSPKGCIVLLVCPNYTEIFCSFAGSHRVDLCIKHDG